MRETKERELKLTAPDEFGLGEDLGEPIESRVFASTYYDTPDRALATVGITLRRRLENGKSVWQLKLPGDGFRRELEVPGGPARPPRALLDPLFALVRDQRLGPTAKLNTRRSGVHVREDGRDIAEIVLDSVSVMDDGRVQATFSEIEVELLEGGTDVLDRVGKALRRRGRAAKRRAPESIQGAGLHAVNPRASRRSSRPASRRRDARPAASGDARARCWRPARLRPRGSSSDARRRSPSAGSPTDRPSHSRLRRVRAPKASRGPRSAGASWTSSPSVR